MCTKNGKLNKKSKKTKKLKMSVGILKLIENKNYRMHRF